MGNLTKVGGVAGASASFAVDDTGALSVTDTSGSTIFAVSATGVVTQSSASLGAAHVLSDDFVKATIAVANGSGGTNTAALTLQLHRMDGTTPITSAKQVAIYGSTLQYARNNPSGTLTFSSATVGSLEYNTSGYAIVKTDATGAFACTVTNSADQTLYFMATVPDAVTALADGLCSVTSNLDSATWSA